MPYHNFTPDEWMADHPFWSLHKPMKVGCSPAPPPLPPLTPEARAALLAADTAHWKEKSAEFWAHIERTLR